MNIPFTKPYIGKEEEKAVISAMRTTLGTGDGPFTKLLTEKLQQLTKAKHVLPVTSCTHGLELALSAFDLQKGDEVIVPSFTMSSTANAVLVNGATPVFADIDPVFFNIDPMDIEKKISKKTRGIIIVHYAGMACDMERIWSVAKKKKLFIIEDAAHTIGAYYKDTMLGNVSDIGVYSFHGTKNVTCGEGGAVLTNNTKLFHRMEIYRANGTNRNAFLRGVVDKYSWVGKGSSYFLSDILAAMASMQIDRVKSITRERQKIAAYFITSLKRYANFITLPTTPNNCKPNWHIFAIRFPKEEQRDSFVQIMRGKGVEISTHYVPLHSSVMGKRLLSKVKLPITDGVARTIARFPIWPGMKKKEMAYIIRCTKETLKQVMY